MFRRKEQQYLNYYNEHNGGEEGRREDSVGLQRIGAARHEIKKVGGNLGGWMNQAGGGILR